MPNPNTNDHHPAGIAMRRQTYEGTLAAIAKPQHGFRHPVKLTCVTEAGTERIVADAMTVTLGKPPAAAPGERIQFEASRRAGDPQAPLTYIRKVRPSLAWTTASRSSADLHPQGTAGSGHHPQDAGLATERNGGCAGQRHREHQEDHRHLYRKPGVTKRQIARQTSWTAHTIRAALQSEPNRCLECKQPAAPYLLRCPQCLNSPDAKA